MSPYLQSQVALLAILLKDSKFGELRLWAIGMKSYAYPKGKTWMCSTSAQLLSAVNIFLSGKRRTTHKLKASSPEKNWSSLFFWWWWQSFNGHIYNSETNGVDPLQFAFSFFPIFRMIRGTIFGPGHLVLSRTVSGHCLEVHVDEGHFPIGSLDEVSLFWRLKDSDSMDSARLW